MDLNQRDRDAFWQDVVAAFLNDRLALWFPASADQFDWARGYEALSQAVLRVDADDPSCATNARDWVAVACSKFPRSTSPDWSSSTLHCRRRQIASRGSRSPTARRSRRARDAEARLERKKPLIVGLADAGFSLADAQRIVGFYDWLLPLPRPLAQRLITEIHELSEGKQMPYVTSFEEYGRERGLEQGQVAGYRGAIGFILRERFAMAAEPLIADVNRIDSVETLKRLVSRLLRVATADQARQALAEVRATV